MNHLLEIQAEVAAALAVDGPVVALESTVISHGLPYPTNVETAIAMEEAVRAAGAVPATLAILAGQVKIGLTKDEIAYLGQRPSDTIRKSSRRDLATVIAAGGDGATTVAGTILLAHMADIEFMATGGIGGVHRGHPFDVSADLTELGRTPVTVFCSGFKSILDLPLTREYLETQGVAVVGYGTDALPSFFSVASDLAVDVRLDTPAAVAALVRARRALKLYSATLITVPVPVAAALDAAAAEAAIERATREVDAAGVRGAATTPWLLSRIVELTDGRSLRANVALLTNNARVAGETAVAFAQSRRGAGVNRTDASSERAAR